MPIFEYRCSACDHLEEVLQKHGEPPPDPCPKCGAAHTLSKELSLTSFQLKGGGWYKDLYSSTTPASKSDSDGGSGGSASLPAPSSTAAPAPAAAAPAAETKAAPAPAPAPTKPSGPTSSAA